MFPSSQHKGATMAAARSSPFFPCDSEVFRKKMGRDLRPLFGPGNPAPKMGFTSLFNANADSAGRVVGPHSGQESGPILFVIFVVPGVFSGGLSTSGPASHRCFFAGLFLDDFPGSPSYRHFCVKTARAERRGTSQVLRVAVPGGRVQARF
mgnify:CR=1 FL=1